MNILNGKNKDLKRNSIYYVIFMTKSRRKKRFSKERRNCNPENKCLKCGEPLKDASHHFFCNDCYTPGLIYSKEVRRKLYGW